MQVDMGSPDMCRICLGSEEDPDLKMLFQDFSEESSIIQKIELCGGIKVEISDDLPKKICGECISALNISYEFRKRCQDNDYLLRNSFTVQKMDIKEESEWDRSSLYETVYLSELSNESSACTVADDKVETEEEPIKSAPLKKAFPNRLGKKAKRQEVQVCELCGNIYKRSNQLILHMRRHTAEKPFNCEICMKTFTCQSEIKRHMRVHTGVKPYKCKYCDRKFSDSSTNIKHERTHTNERPFTCAKCGKSFTYSCVLKNHMLTHTGEKSFRCDVCDKTFSRAHQLKQHLMTITHQQKERKLNISSKGFCNNNSQAESPNSTGFEKLLNAQYEIK